MTRPTPAPDLSAWLTKQQVAERIGVSTKTIEKFASDCKLQSARRGQAGRPAVVVYHPDDVERLRQERHPEPEPFVVPPVSEALQKGSPTSQMVPVNSFALALMEGLREVFQNASQASRLFLSIKESSELSGLPQTLLKHWIQEGKLKALKTGRGWRIRRKDLEGL